MFYCLFYVVFFFFKQKTAYEMRISDWSSDVCSSDLVNDALTDPALIAQLDSLEQWLRSQPEVGSVVSYVDHLKLINRAFNDDDPAAYVIPSSAAAVKQLLVFGGGDAIRHVVDPQFRAALMKLRSEEHTSELQSLMRNSY